MSDLDDLFSKNRAWANGVRTVDPDYFLRLSKQQAPKYLWIGCSDSRVPANQIIDLPPGEVFVHRNIANVVVHTDLNCLSVIHYAVAVLQVDHIIVCGHYGCGGVMAALDDRFDRGLIDNWLRHIQDVYRQHRDEVDALDTDQDKVNRLCELNVMAQVANVRKAPTVRRAWATGQSLSVHGVIYGLEDGLLKNLDVSVSGEA